MVFIRSIAFGAALLSGVAVQAQTVAPPPATTLPEVTVRPPVQNPSYYDPYTSGTSQHASSLNHIWSPHYQVPVGYDSNAALHPYTSGVGPCPEGAVPDTGCWRPTRRIQPSHYERPPFTRP